MTMMTLDGDDAGDDDDITVDVDVATTRITF